LPDQVRNTFGNLSNTLRELGFKEVRRGGYIVFTHASGRPMLLLPAYKKRQAVRAIHMMMIRKQLTDVGMIKPGGLALRMRAKSRVRTKT
jgi:hypothetical protein